MSDEVRPGSAIATLFETAGLSEIQMDAIRLFHLNGSDYHEVAKVLGISENAARKRVYNGVQRLREYAKIRGITRPTSDIFDGTPLPE